MLDFLNRCRLKDSKVILCPRGNFVFDKEAAKELDMTNPYQSKKFIRHDKPKELFSKEKAPKSSKVRLTSPLHMHLLENGFVLLGNRQLMGKNKK